MFWPIFHFFPLCWIFDYCLVPFLKVICSFLPSLQDANSNIPTNLTGQRPLGGNTLFSAGEGGWNQRARFVLSSQSTPCMHWPGVLMHGAGLHCPESQFSVRKSSSLGLLGIMLNVNIRLDVCLYKFLIAFLLLTCHVTCSKRVWSLHLVPASNSLYPDKIFLTYMAHLYHCPWRCCWLLSEIITNLSLLYTLLQGIVCHLSRQPIMVHRWRALHCL